MIPRAAGRLAQLLTNAGCLLSLAATVACAKPPAASAPNAVGAPAATQPAAAESASRLSAQGCVVELPGAWKEPTLDDGYWNSESLSAEEDASLLALPWHEKDPSEWKLDLEALLGVRRDADREQDPQLALSDIEYIEGSSPAALYTSTGAKGERTATMVKASVTLGCVVFFSSQEPDPQVFAGRAKALLAKVRVEK